MKHEFKRLFTPGRIGTLEIPNRIVKAPTSTGMSNMDGSVSERLFRHYQNIARGGVGLLIVEYAYVDDIASKSAHCQLGISSNEHISGLAWLTEMIKGEGARAGIQIEHCGRQKFLGTRPIKSASAVPWPSLQAKTGDAVPDELSVEEIKEIVSAFGDAAARAVSAGFDLVEIHGAHGYLITNFLSPHTNKRTDQYGGSLENRMRLLVEVVKDARSKIGPDFPLTVRLSGTDYEPDGFGIEETVEVAKVLESIGIDAIHTSGGDHHQMIHQVSPMGIPRGNNVWAAAELKKHLKIPVIASGSITLPDFAEEVLAEGKGDFIGLGRPLWADPQWPNKAREGRLDEIRPCVRCNCGCLDRGFFKFRSVVCSVNPTIGREEEIDIIPAPVKRKVAVVGGGPAGLEAARVAKLRGHDVTLYERRKLGGVLHEASVSEFKSDLRFLIRNMAAQVNSAGVNVVMEAADARKIKAGGYDVVILATGGKATVPEVPGITGPTVVDALEVFGGTATPGKNVVVLGGGETAVEAALYLADLGRSVTLLHRRELMVKDVVITDKIVYLERLETKKVKVMIPYQVVGIEGGSITARHTQSGETISVTADTIVTALGYVPATNGLAKELRQQGVELHEIGDGVRTAKIFDAIHAGYKLSRSI